MTQSGDQPLSDEHHLACVLLAPSGRIWLDQLLADVAPEDFADPVLSWIWSAAKLLHGRSQPISRRSLSALRETVSPSRRPGEPRQRGEVIAGLPLVAPAANILHTEISRLLGTSVSAPDLATLSRHVRENGRLRRLAHRLDVARQSLATATDYGTALQHCQEALSGAEEVGPAGDIRAFPDLVDEFWSWQRRPVQPGEVIPTPWPEVDEHLSGGVHSGRMIVFAGRPGAGKTNAGIELLARASELGHTTLLVSQEMSALEVTGRALAQGARVPYRQIVRRTMDADTHASVTAYAQRHRDMPMFVIDRPGMSVEHVGAASRSLHRTSEVRIIGVDYAQLLEASDSRVNRVQQVSHISRSLKLLSRELSCAVVLLSQLNRDSVKDRRRPELSDLKESGSLEQDPDVVILIHHVVDSSGQHTGIVELIIAKNRFGKTAIVELPWRGDQARMG